jgi:hypothetical protein
VEATEEIEGIVTVVAGVQKITLILTAGTTHHTLAIKALGFAFVVYLSVLSAGM